MKNKKEVPNCAMCEYTGRFFMNQLCLAQAGKNVGLVYNNDLCKKLYKKKEEIDYNGSTTLNKEEMKKILENVEDTNDIYIKDKLFDLFDIIDGNAELLDMKIGNSKIDKGIEIVKFYIDDLKQDRELSKYFCKNCKYKNETLKEI